MEDILFINIPMYVVINMFHFYTIIINIDRCCVV